jgi:hypothetical protein
LKVRNCKKCGGEITGKRCKPCYKLYLREYHKNWYLKNAEKLKKRSADYFIKNKEIEYKKRIEWREKNKEKDSRYHKNWREKNRGVVTAHTQKRNAIKKRATPIWFDESAVKKIYEKAAMRTKTEGIVYHVDHIIPINSPLVCGLHCVDNLQILRYDDNIRKGNKL